MDAYEIARPSGRCHVTGRELAEGEAFYAVLFEEGEGFRRADYSLEAWSGPPAGSFCHFKSRVAVKTHKRKLLVDDDILINFFERLGAETEPLRVHLRFVLALILLRKRLLKYEDTARGEDDTEVWMMRLKDGALQRVVNPRLTDDQVTAVSQQLGVILSGDAGTFDDEAAPIFGEGGSLVE
ncbi:MAG TPA: hypothetical protein VGM03_01620 [Phycisphaerae bacterium]